MATRRELRESEQSMTSMLLEVIGPALIMLMIGSLVFFLIEVFYRGPHTARLCWVFALFTFASVLVARISIQSGRERALAMGSALGLAAFVTSFTLVEFEGAMGIIMEPILLILFIAVVMWSASKLTWDCTVIDKSRDTSAIGITELVRRRVQGTDSGASEPSDSSNPGQDTSETSDAQAGNLIKAFFQSKSQRKNTPGIWVFYFSMAALPIFGIGQWFVSPTHEGGYGWVVFLFGIYLASGLGLMMTTSLLGLQRYLRKRRTFMPPEIARTWMAIGTVISIVVVILVMVFPRPNAPHAIAKSLQWFTSPPRESSDLAFGKDGTEEKQSGNSSKSSEQGKQSSANAKTQQTSGNSKNAKKTQGGGKGRGKNSSGSSKSQQKGGQKSSKQQSGNQESGKQQSGQQQSSDSTKNQNQQNKNQNSGESENQNSNQQSDSTSDDGKQAKTNVPDHMRPDKSAEEAKRRNEEKAQQQQENQDNQDSKSSSGSNESSSKSSTKPNHQSSPKTPNAPKSPSLQALSQIATVITYIVAGVAMVVLLVLFRKEILAAIKSIIAELQSLLGKKKAADEPSSDILPTPTPTSKLQPFSHYRNPFQSGSANSMTPEKIVEYTFLALEAWALEHDLARPQDQTPHEFAAALRQVNPAISQSATQLCNLFCKNLFGEETVQTNELEPLKELWILMQNSTLSPKSPIALAT